jgi:hypothetical protein
MRDSLHYTGVKMSDFEQYIGRTWSCIALARLDGYTDLIMESYAPYFERFGMYPTYAFHVPDYDVLDFEN